MALPERMNRRGILARDRLAVLDEVAFDGSVANFRALALIAGEARISYRILINAARFQGPMFLRYQFRTSGLFFLHAIVGGASNNKVRVFCRAITLDNGRNA